MGRYLILFLLVLAVVFDLLFTNAHISLILLPLFLWGWDDVWALILFFTLGVFILFVLSVPVVALVPGLAYLYLLRRHYAKFAYMHLGWFELSVAVYYASLLVFGVARLSWFSLLLYLLIGFTYQRYILSLERSRLLKL